MPEAESSLQPTSCMEEQGNDTRGARQENPLERERKRNPAEQQDLEKPADGRDVPPAEVLRKGKRDPKSPWMGGG
jgi:hypothetical protein